MADFQFKVNEKVIVVGRAEIAVINAAYTVENWAFYSVNKFPGFLIRQDHLQSLDNPQKTEPVERG